MRRSILLLPAIGSQINVTGNPVKAAGYFGISSGLHTIAAQLEDFTGRLFIEASLESDPNNGGWFPIYLTGINPYVEYPEIPSQPTGNIGDSGTVAYTFEGNFVWLRARVDRSYLGPSPGNVGTIIKILVNYS